MEKIYFSIEINASKQKVWDTMLDDATYRMWTKAFHPGSYYVGNWNEGSEIRFLGPDENGNLDAGGMYSKIKENRRYDFISIEHLGIITQGVVDTTSDEVKKWAPAFENYTLEEIQGGTRLSIDMEISKEYRMQFEEMWPKALLTLKELSEK